MIVKIEGIWACLAIISLWSEASKALDAAKLAKSGRLINIVRSIHTFEAVIAPSAVGTPTLTLLAAMGRRIGIEREWTGSLTFLKVQEHRCLAFTAVS